jgi:hypothetical protein
MLIPECGILMLSLNTLERKRRRGPAYKISLNSDQRVSSYVVLSTKVKLSLFKPWRRMEGVDREISPSLISAQKGERAKQWFCQLHVLAITLPSGK